MAAQDRIRCRAFSLSITVKKSRFSTSGSMSLAASSDQLNRAVVFVTRS